MYFIIKKVKWKVEDVKFDICHFWLKISIHTASLIVILRNGADIQKKNDRGESSYDLAAKGNYETIVKKFASTLGQSQLLKMTKPKY